MMNYPSDFAFMNTSNAKFVWLTINILSFGAKYAYNSTNQTFDFYEGEPCCFDDRIEGSQEIDIEIDYPKTVYLVDGHPEVFSANGSHGTWGAEGK